MGDVADNLDSLVVRVTSPDNNIMARLTNRTQVTFEFRPDSFSKYEKSELEKQLAKACRVLWVNYIRGYSEAMEKVGLNFKTKPEDAATPAERRFLTERSQLGAFGNTKKGYIEIKTLGLIKWKVRITDKALTELSESQFLAELHTAGRALMHDFNRKMVFLKDECYDMGLARQIRARGIEPPSWR